MTAEIYLPGRRTLPALQQAVQECRGCELYKHATQAVFGEGPADAALVLVGEQPGDSEDLQGQPFVGAAGRLLSDVLEEIGLARESVYVTNVVKHFKWTPSGQRRLHKKPSSREIKDCQPWLEAELAVIQPTGIVCLGATAAQALLGREFRVTQQRGQIVPRAGQPWVLATWHPSAVLRAPDTSAREKMRNELKDDLSRAAAELAD